MRDLDTIDSELRLLAAVRRSIREHGGEPSSRQVDELLDERNGLSLTELGPNPVFKRHLAVDDDEVRAAMLSAL
jgi:hypothetical protein